MTTYDFLEAREALPSAISTLPPDYLDGNAAQLLQIVNELERSLLVELKIGTIVTNLQLGADRETKALRGEVGAAIQALEQYAQGYALDDERTRCHTIDIVAGELLAPRALPVAGGADLVASFAALLEPLRDADNDYLDELQNVVGDALSALREISDSLGGADDQGADLAAARARQSAFAAQIEQRQHTARGLLRQMRSRAWDLLDRLR